MFLIIILNVILIILNFILALYTLLFYYKTQKLSVFNDNLNTMLTVLECILSYGVSDNRVNTFITSQTLCKKIINNKKLKFLMNKKDYKFLKSIYDYTILIFNEVYKY